MLSNYNYSWHISNQSSLEDVARFIFPLVHVHNYFIVVLSPVQLPDPVLQVAVSAPQLLFEGPDFDQKLIVIAASM